MNNKWISVKERLPKINETVLCGVKGGGIVLSLCEYIKKGFRPITNAWIDDRITHWQPLPNPPDEEDENMLEKAKKLWQNGNHIEAVKLMCQSGYGLKEAKNYCDENFGLLPNLAKSTENLSKIKNKDEWLDEVRGKEGLEEKFKTELNSTKHWNSVNDFDVDAAAKQCSKITQQYTNSKLEELEKKSHDEKVHYEALLECCNKILDTVDAGRVPQRQIIGLRILLNRPKK